LSEQPLDLKASVAVIWRRRRVVGAVAAIGLLGGLAYGVIQPAMPSAVALVLLPPSGLTTAGTAARDVNTEIAIAESVPVLSAAGKSLSPAIQPAKLKGQVAVTALTQDILQVEVRASRAVDAERLANAVANDYIQYVATSGATSTGNALAGLRAESAQLTQQIQNLQSQINTVSARVTAEGASSPSGQQDSSLLGSLSNAQREASLNLVNVNNQVVTTQLSGAAAAQGTRILQRATSVVASSNLSVFTTGGIGLALGLFGGIPIALWRSRRDRRLRLRDEIAGAIAVPVFGSIEAQRHKTAADWTTLLEEYRPSPVDEWNLHQVLVRLASEHVEEGSEIRVLSFAGDSAALAAGPQLAMFAEELGVPTNLVCGAHEAFAPLRAACAARPTPAPARDPVTSRAQGYGFDRFGGLTVSTVAVDAMRPELDPAPGVMLLAVSAGFATADFLARLALAALDTGHPIDGVLVVNADASDDTTGSGSDGGLTQKAQSRHEWTSAQLFPYNIGPTVTAGAEAASLSSANGSATNGKVATAEGEEPEGQPGAFVSLRVLSTAAGRHWRPLLATALVGLLIGAGFHLVVPRKYASVTDLFLTEPAASDPAQAMANDTSLLQTRAVAQRAVVVLHLHTTADSFLASYQGLALSNAILSITASAHSQTDAVSEGNAVAQAFLRVRTDELNLQTQVVVRGLQAQVNSLDHEITNLSSSIDVLSATPAGSQSGNELADLVEQRSEDTSQVAQVESQIQQEQLNASSVTQASQVLDPAAAVKVSAKKVTIMDALSGLIGGLGLAIVALVVGVLLSDRLRSREEVAAALGAPVELSLFHWASRREMRTRHRRELVMHPTPALAMIERRLRAHLESAGGSALAVVEVESSEPCALAVAALAFSLTSEGRRVVIADMADERPVASLFGVTSDEKKVHTVTLEDHSVVLLVAPDDMIEMGPGWTPKGTDVLLVLASADAAFGSQHLAAWVTKAVVVVNMRRATTTAVSATGEMLRQARIVIRSAILVGADPEDDGTVGAAPSNDLADTEQSANGVLQASRR